MKHKIRLMDTLERTKILKLIQQEVIPAIGCTEPISVALCTAKATEILGTIPEKITVYLSANILKNAMGVGIPGTGMIGLPIAIALGALIGKSEYQLEVLKECTHEAVKRGKKMIDQKSISISLKENIQEKLYIEVCCQTSQNHSTAIIAGEHTHFIYISKNNDVLLDKKLDENNNHEEQILELNLQKVYDFATTSPINEIRFILESARTNRYAAEQSFKYDFGHSLGKTLRGKFEHKIMGDSIFSHILSYTSAACDARMAGAMIPIMSNSGSGNQGIAATLPIVIYAEENGKSVDELIRALILSHLTVIYIKQCLGRLSALCGCVVAATGSSCGITYLMGGKFPQISATNKGEVQFVDLIGAKNGSGATFKATDLYWPIPVNEIQRNPNLTQNEGYSAK